MRHHPGAALSWLAIAILGGCGAPAATMPPQDAFWSAIDGLCGRAFPGRVVAAAAIDSALSNRDLVMHVRSCQQNELRIPFHVGADRSRTWVLSRGGGQLQLHHEIRDLDGAMVAPSGFGGRAAGPGAATRQEFPADSATSAALPAAARDVWIIEIHPGKQFSYELRRGDPAETLRIEFDLSRPLPTPPAPWGSPVP